MSKNELIENVCAAIVNEFVEYLEDNELDPYDDSEGTDVSNLSDEICALVSGIINKKL